MVSGGWIFLIVLALVLLPAAGFFFFTRIRAQRQGLPPPALSSYNPFANRHRSSQYSSSTRSGGVVGWAKSKFSSLRGGSGGAGGYGPTGQQRGLDPDGAWDTRVGDEADGYGHGGYYEEQELGLHPPSGGYAGGGYGPSHSQALPGYGEEVERGRSRSRDEGFIGGGPRGLDQRYEEEVGRANQDPFADGAERSELRGVDFPPAELDAGSMHHGQKGKGGGHHDDSPTERRSMFHENM